ncbi:MAG: aspartate aminotransferase family protein [Myxococcales bacterium]|nr:aspartate aminotransferase family protein [Myxococcales bacterium]
MELPKTGVARDALFAEMRKNKEADADWRGGRTFSLIYPTNDEIDDVLAEANELYLYENALNPFRFPSLRQMEVDVVEMTGGMLHAPIGFGGCMTSGGTESIIMAVKAARERAKAERGVERGELLAPVTAHPAFAKAASYLGLDLVQIPIGADHRADVAAAEGLLSERTALVVGSAPNYPFGTVDPIPELSALAAERGISFHTDSCLGGFMLPFLEKLGEDIPPFDFRVPGVTTMSADVHKYGYCTKGASTVLHRDDAHLKKYQLFVYQDWPGGLYASFAMAGARPAAPISAAWAVMRYLGEEGYLRLAREAREATRKLQDGIGAIAGLRVIGAPVMTVFAFGAEDDSIDLFAVGDVMDDRGWHIDRQHGPDALHVMVSPKHLEVADAFLADLREAVANHGSSRGKEARYS